jgi:tetratricopeptide (TPR) repeat protein
LLLDTYVIPEQLIAELPATLVELYTNAEHTNTKAAWEQFVHDMYNYELSDANCSKTDNAYGGSNAALAQLQCEALAWLRIGSFASDRHKLICFWQAKCCLDLKMSLERGRSSFKDVWAARDLGNQDFNFSEISMEMLTHDAAFHNNEQAIRIRFPEAHAWHMAYPSQISGLVYNMIGNALFDLGEFHTALCVLQAALDMRFQSIDPTQPEYVDCASTINSIGVVLFCMGSFAASRYYFEAAADLIAQFLPLAHVRRATIRENITISQEYAVRTGVKQIKVPAPVEEDGDPDALPIMTLPTYPVKLTGLAGKMVKRYDDQRASKKSGKQSKKGKKGKGKKKNKK